MTPAPPESNPPLERKLMREDVYTHLREWIICGVLEPEEKLRDQDLAARLGVSRTPVREALRRLEDEGLVETRAQSYTRVTAVEFQSAKRIYPILGLLEPLALEFAFSHLQTHHLETMRKANLALEKAIKQDDARAAAYADSSFHGVYLSEAHHPELEGILNQLKTQHLRFEIHFWKQRSTRLESTLQHAAVISALKGGDLELAKEYLALNWSRGPDLLKGTDQ